MCKLELVSVEVDTKKTYSSNDRFTFSITVNAMESIPDDVEFEAHYFGDAYSEHHDQKIGSALIGPFEQGKQRFDLETELIDFTKIPIKTLFGLTTILIVAKYKGQQFLRIGYVVNVGYPGVDQNVLADSDDKPLDFPEEESNPEEEEEEIEIMDDEELDEDE
ncbi:histone chaperone ASF1, partial [Pancytospora epiphaga]